MLPVLYFISSMFASSNDEHFSPTVFGILYFHLPPVIAIRFLCALWFSDIASDLISRFTFSFEYLWMFQGYLIQHRLSMIEQNWPYFLGFGMPLTVITMISNNFVVNAAIFGIFYPLFISSSCMVRFYSFLLIF
ncbi:unnamed protein product [Dracunculus medinensis]|uniref:Uncharacterized protein n=1 Tax=Dracunculus medinensis TaxID=318479 RepID=A0A3P7PFW2_DRAME|nr:unnamed protein product [Dracunculus medinensis]